METQISPHIPPHVGTQTHTHIKVHNFFKAHNLKVGFTKYTTGTNEQVS